MGGAETYTVDFYGDGLISFDVGPKVTAVPTRPDGRPVKSLVSNTGRIDAPGGTVLLTADAAAGIVENVVDVHGRIAARTSGQTPGSVTIDAGPGGAAKVSGKIDVSGLKPGETGGSATVTGGSVNLASRARIIARGNAGGGTVKIGGGPHGQDPTVRNSQNATVAAGAVIDASAVGSGNGGKVTVWADNATVFNGTISASGGAQGGNGGSIETSGQGTLVVGPAASVTAAAPKGTAGQWLLDPDSNVTITNTSSPPLASCGGSPFVCLPSADSSNLLVSTINTALRGGTSVTVTTSNPHGTQNGDITVSAPISFSSSPPFGVQQLVLNAAGNISILSPITGSTISTSQSLTLELFAGGTISEAAAASISMPNLIASGPGGGAGSVSLPGDNAVGRLTGSVITQTGSFLFRNDQHNLAIGPGGISTNGGPITVVTTGTCGTAGCGLTILTGSFVSSLGGRITLMAGGAGGTFLNQGTIGSKAASPPAAGNITIVADAISLASSPPSVDAGTTGTVMLGPFTAANGIALGTTGPTATGVLGLTQADLNQIAAGTLQVGYRKTLVPPHSPETSTSPPRSRSTRARFRTYCSLRAAWAAR